MTGTARAGIGAGADPAVVDAVAVAADDCGFATLWVGEHVVMVDRPASRYPYSRDGVIAVPAQADWLDPMIALSFAAAASSRVDVATGVLLLPEHNPVIVAKEAASLDRLSGRRLTLGVASDGPRRSSTRSSAIRAARRAHRRIRRCNAHIMARRRRIVRRQQSGRDRGELRLAVALANPQVGDVDVLANWALTSWCWSRCHRIILRS